MTEETITENQEQTLEEDYLDQIKNLKENTVSKDEYLKLKREHTKLLKDYVDGTVTATEGPKTQVPERTVRDIKKELFTPNRQLSDVEYVTKTLELRKKVIDETGVDCFVPHSHNYSPTDSDFQKAEKVAKVLQDCVDLSDGDNGKFIANLQSKMNDVALPSRRR